MSSQARVRRGLVPALVILLVAGLVSADEGGDDRDKDKLKGPQPLTMVVMDPLAAPLACDCVQGYAQRKYEKLGAFLQARLKRPVKVAWAEALETALHDETGGRADLIIGKHSVVLSDAKEARMKVAPIAGLTDQLGRTTQRGLIVVRSADSAQTVADLKGYRVFFGPANCDEKSAAPMALLKKHGVKIASKPETYPACSTAATALVELETTTQAAAVISSYAQPLLEGCGAIQKGDLRVIGRSEPVPFVTAFVNTAQSREQREAIKAALLEVGENAELLMALETAEGFIPLPKTKPKKAVAATDQSAPADAKKK